MSLVAWSVIILLILVTALYVAAEFAAVGVRRSRIHQLAENGNLLARRLLPILEDATRLDQYIAACQIGITLSSLVLGAIGQATVALDLAALLREAFGWQAFAAHSAAAATILVLLTVLQVVFGELAPKSLALQYPTQVALYTYLPMKWSLIVYGPFIGALNGSGALILRMLGMSQVGGHRHIHSPEEIDMLIAESRDGGLLEPEEQQRLHQALQLSRRTARQLMVPRRLVVALECSTPADQILELAIESPYTRLPVYRETIDNVIGLVHTKDLAGYYARQGHLPPLEKVLRPMTSVPSSITADRLVMLMRQHRSRQVLVLDEFGGMEGIVSLEDVLTELVGDVADELKGEAPAPETLPDGRVRLPGMLHLDEAAEWTGGAWENDEADTVGGCVLAALGAVPCGGERVRIDGMEVEVERMDGPVILSLLVTPKSATRFDDAPQEAEP